ncbi:MAG: hypothetical protein NT079_02295, partial [Candidatus Omnitrophica bacterium]|nr:hypothetical protein [Candidatus Omnitrophota bacterium]
MKDSAEARVNDMLLGVGTGSKYANLPEQTQESREQAIILSKYCSAINDILYYALQQARNSESLAAEKTIIPQPSVSDAAGVETIPPDNKTLLSSNIKVKVADDFEFKIFDFLVGLEHKLGRMPLPVSILKGDDLELVCITKEKVFDSLRNRKLEQGEQLTFFPSPSVKDFEIIVKYTKGKVSVFPSNQRRTWAIDEVVSRAAADVVRKMAEDAGKFIPEEKV